jgi:hypothetical protein
MQIGKHGVSNKIVSLWLARDEKRRISPSAPLESAAFHRGSETSRSRSVMPAVVQGLIWAARSLDCRLRRNSASLRFLAALTLSDQGTRSVMATLRRRPELSQVSGFPQARTRSVPALLPDAERRPRLVRGRDVS